MLRMNPKQILAVTLAVLMLRPYPMQAASPAAVLGSISSYGAVTVGEITAPAENTLFSGDLVNTHVGSAVAQYKAGTRVLVAKESSVHFSADAVQLQKGQMTFRSASEQGPIFQAYSLRLEPVTPQSSANVVVLDGKASIVVTEGSVRAVDPTGVSLALINAGETKLFAMASAPAAPAAPAASPAASAAPAFIAGSLPIFIL
ncbi:MAG: hypothetical protein EXQ56_12660, partial [Acidobacteria bacterium]|nr:hypothetical protein [Acidobacteriota bacterium]